jgi:predicted component of type VI protein secretion system
MKFYSIPFVASDVVAGRFSQTGLNESVRQHIRLLLTSIPTSYRFAPIYGSWLNKHHFKLPDKRRGDKKMENEMKENLQTNVRLLIEKFEPRLQLSEVEVTVILPKPDQFDPRNKGGRILFDINLIGIVDEEEDFEHKESVYLK